MAHQRAHSSTAAGGSAHAVSLKVLRLSRPSLAPQTPLPQTSFGSGLDIEPQASLASPSPGPPTSFPLAPVLTLPAQFGAAYVGETFTCTLCANNEIPAKEQGDRTVSNVRISAHLQTPSSPDGMALELSDAAAGEGLAEEGQLVPGTPMQRTLTHELKEPGPHVLAVTVTYTDATHAEGAHASGARVRTFRKLYQFVAQQLIAVRSKVTERKQRDRAASARQWVLEAQLENTGDTSAVLEQVHLVEREGIESQACNAPQEKTVLKPQDVQQVMFLLQEDRSADGAGSNGGKVVLAQLTVGWRNAMGEEGSVTTGSLASKPR